KVNISKSQGPDELNPKLIFELRNELCEPLTYLFNMSIQTGVIPQDWRDAIVASLHKKGSKSKSENYRPVSLTSIISKLLESIVKDNLVKHLDKYALIRSSQHGFTSGKSCLSNLLDFFEEVTRNLDEGDSGVTSRSAVGEQLGGKTLSVGWQDTSGVAIFFAHQLPDRSILPSKTADDLFLLISSSQIGHFYPQKQLMAFSFCSSALRSVTFTIKNK